MAHEVSLAPPNGVRYEFLTARRRRNGLIRTSVKGSMRRYDDRHVDIVEAILSPAITERPWICSLDCFQAAMAFSLLGCPLPKAARRHYLMRLFLRDNFKQLIFWSNAARASLERYGEVVDQDLIAKAVVVYPAVRDVPEPLLRKPATGLRLLFCGDFFRKGGAHVVDAFHAIQNDFPEATLRLCCDELIDFNTPNRQLRDEYLAKISRNNRIKLGRVRRDVMITQILPNTDIYLLPTYDEAFGFAILEAMSFSIPVIASNVFAIPEIICADESGLLIDVSDVDMGSFCKGYIVRQIPSDVKAHITELLVASLIRLAEKVF